MSKKLDIENRISTLEAELAAGVAPNARKSFESPMAESSQTPTERYLEYLELLKRQKDRGSRVWEKIKNWD